LLETCVIIVVGAALRRGMLLLFYGRLACFKGIVFMKSLIKLLWCIWGCMSEVRR